MYRLSQSVHNILYRGQRFFHSFSMSTAKHSPYRSWLSKIPLDWMSSLPFSPPYPPPLLPFPFPPPLPPLAKFILEIPLYYTFYIMFGIDRVVFPYIDVTLGITNWSSFSLPTSPTLSLSLFLFLSHSLFVFLLEISTLHIRLGQFV